MMEENNKIMLEMERSKAELDILYEISNAMRTTLKLDEILYIILTGVTAHTGLAFNRALLFLVNTKDNLIEGKMAIGPESGEEANAIWKKIEQEKMDLDDLISAYKGSKKMLDQGLSQQVKRLKIPLQDESGGILALSVLDGMPLHLTRETIKNYANDPLIQLLKIDEVAIVPLKAKDKVNGIIVADNFITKKPIDKDDMRMLIMLSNQAGLAIENSHLYERAIIRAHTDSLTDLWNHGYFHYLLQQEVEKSKAIANNHFSVIMIDIDNFKIYNDTLGHQAGDTVLKELSSLLKGQSRKMDFVCRYGGEEFAIFLPHTAKEEAYLIAERLRCDIERYEFSSEEILPNQKLTVSLGVSTFPEDGLAPSDLISYADKALYQAKHLGRNRTCG